MDIELQKPGFYKVGDIGPGCIITCNAKLHGRNIYLVTNQDVTDPDTLEEGSTCIDVYTGEYTCITVNMPCTLLCRAGIDFGDTEKMMSFKDTPKGSVFLAGDFSAALIKGRMPTEDGDADVGVRVITGEMARILPGDKVKVYPRAKMVLEKY